jgi:hypothetical protein
MDRMMDAADARDRAALIVDAAIGRARRGAVADTTRAPAERPTEIAPPPRGVTFLMSRRPCRSNSQRLLLREPLPMGTKREPTAPSQMTREQLEALVTGLFDHRLAVIEERLPRWNDKPTAFPLQVA